MVATETAADSQKSTGGIQHFKDGIIDLLAGTAGGTANVYSAQPLDTIKVKMQAFPSIYKNWVACFHQTFRVEGVRGLYAGSIPALIANVSENSILFFSYGFCQKAVANLVGSPSVKQMTPVQNASAGSIAAFFAALVLCPTELVKCQLQAQTELNPNVHRTPFSISREMYKTSGVRSFYTGLVATLLREIPGYFFFFGAYELSRKCLTPKGKTKDEIGIFRTAISGGIGGMALWAAIFPADVVKSRMQVGQQGTFSSIFMKIYREEGIKAFYKGLSPTLIRTCIASGALFIVYENTKQILGRIL